MKRHLTFLFFALLLSLAACVGSPEETRVRRTVESFEQTFAAALDRKAKPAALKDYFATEADGANVQGIQNTRNAFLKMLDEHVNGVSLVQLSNFRITQVDIHQDVGLAKVTYQMDLKIVHGTQQGTATLVQNLALLKTPRGWRISGGEPWRYADVMGTLPWTRISKKGNQV